MKVRDHFPDLDHDDKLTLKWLMNLCLGLDWTEMIRDNTK